MVVRILSSSASFAGVSYNTNKIEKLRGELMKVSGFGPLQGLETLRPEDYKNYLKMVSAQNKRVSKPQFHAVISAKGKGYDKASLTEIAIRWLSQMGYADQPYLVVYHNDTGNNHVHLVSTRIGKDGKKISSGFENIRAIQNLHKVLGLDEKQRINLDVQKALSYQFKTRAQFKMILESAGYILKETGGNLQIIKSGILQDEIKLMLIDERIHQNQPDTDRIKQLKAIFYKHGAEHDTKLMPVNSGPAGRDKINLNGYTSNFAAYMQDKHGIALIFHFKDDKPPYGYSIIDHAEKGVYKGSDILQMKILMAMQQDKSVVDQKMPSKLLPPVPETYELTANREYYRALLSAALNNYPDLKQGLHHQGLEVMRHGDELYLADPEADQYIPVSLLLDGACTLLMERYYGLRPEPEIAMININRPIAAIQIAEDIDDEAIHGRNRRRKKKARTNSR
jgi:hypothetical protein